MTNKEDMVNSPKHYSPGDHEVWKCLREWGLECETFAWNAAKYIARYDKKGDPVENLEKARWYIDKLIEKLKTENDEEKKAVLEQTVKDLKALIPPAKERPLTTNGYCDTCGDMYVEGYNLAHKLCRK